MIGAVLRLDRNHAPRTPSTMASANHVGTFGASALSENESPAAPACSASIPNRPVVYRALVLAVKQIVYFEVWREHA